MVLEQHSMEIVLSRYKNNMDWISEFKTSKLFIYDKSGESNKYFQLPNIGRESHTYLFHIINNYNNLSDYVCFLQAYPFDHTLYRNGNQLANFIESFNKSIDYFPLGSNYKCDFSGRPHHIGLNIKELIFDNYFLSCPNEIFFTPGGCMIVSKSAILCRKKEFYEKMIREFDRNDEKILFTEGEEKWRGLNQMPWILERVWGYIFNKDFKTNYDTNS